MPRSPRSRSRDTSDREAQERRRLEVLYDVTRRLAAVPDSEKVLDFIVNSATTLLAAEAVVEDTSYDERHKRAALALGFHGFLAVPLRAHDRILGVLNVYTKRRRRFEQDEIALL